MTPRPLTPLGIVALGLLAEGPRHPYDMYLVLMQRHEDLIVKIRPGSLYHVIDSLAAADLVAATGTVKQGNRPERTTYEITEAGHALLLDTVRSRLAEPVREYPSFPVLIAESTLLDKDEISALLNRRRCLLELESEQLQHGYSSTIAAGKPPKVLIDVDYLITIKNAEIAWLTKTLDALADNSLEWNSP